jgi:phage-related protein (TIGR01555 family)
MSILSWFRRRHVEPAPTVVTSEVEKPKNDPFTVRALEAMLAFLKGAKPQREAAQRKLRSFKLPDPAPGVVPANAPKMAQDSQIKAVIGFGESYQWDGYGFMGYALLSDLAQVPEFRVPSEIIAEEMTRKWVKIITTSEDDKSQKIGEIEAEIKRFGVQESFRKAFEYDEFFGVGKIYMDFGKVDRMSPLVLDANVEKNSLVGIRVIEPIWCYPNNYNTSDPTAPDFYRPQTWYLLGTETHSTRLLDFVSRPVPDILKPAYMFGGVSLTQLMQPYVENWLRTRQSVSNITHNFSTMVLQTDMSQMITPGGAQALALRGEVYNTSRDNLGLFIADKNKEDLKNVAAPLGGLDKLQAQAQEQMASIARIPLVKMFGIQPTGLNASSDGEIRVFYDSIESRQERIGTPNLRTLLNVIQMNKYGEIDPDISFKWEPLWSLDEKALAEVRKINAETDCAYVDHAILSEEEVRKTIAGEEDSRYSSIDVEDLPDLGEEDGDPGEDVPERDAPDAKLPHAGEKKAA